MSFYDHSEQHFALAASAAASAATSTAMSSALPLLGRSLSTSHIQLSSATQDYYLPGRSSVQDVSQGMVFHSTTASPNSTCLQNALQHFGAYQLGQNPLAQMTCNSSLNYTTTYPPTFNPGFQTTTSALDHHSRDIPTSSLDNVAFEYQQPVHPLDMDKLASSINNLETATRTKKRAEYQPYTVHAIHPFSAVDHSMEDSQQSDSSSSYSPTTSTVNSSTASLEHPIHVSSALPFRPTRCYSTSSSSPSTIYDPDLSRFEVPDEYPPQLFPRHGSLGSLYPMTQSHELIEPLHVPGSHTTKSVPMLATASSTSITSMASMASNASNSSSSSSSVPSGSPVKTRVRRASLNPDLSARMFTCTIHECGRLFKRSEHLKRHVRSVHTLDKPFACPVISCPKRFSRSDNLNQHVRIHRHDKEKTHLKPFTNFTPFLSPLAVE